MQRAGGSAAPVVGAAAPARDVAVGQVERALVRRLVVMGHAEAPGEGAVVQAAVRRAAVRLQLEGRLEVDVGRRGRLVPVLAEDRRGRRFLAVAAVAAQVGSRALPAQPVPVGLDAVARALAAASAAASGAAEAAADGEEEEEGGQDDDEDDGDDGDAGKDLRLHAGVLKRCKMMHAN